MKIQLAVFLALGSMVGFAASDKEHATKVINESANVFSEIMSAPDKGIPRNILDKSQCIGIIPGLKRAGFIIGGKYGKGVLTCRGANGWSAPSIVRVEGGSIGFQI